MRRSILLLLIAVLGSSVLAADQKKKDNSGAVEVKDIKVVNIDKKSDANKPQAPKEDPNKVVATVGSKKITLGEIDKTIMQRMPQLAQLPEDTRLHYMPELRRKVLDMTIVEGLLDDEVAKLGYKVSDADVTAKVKEICTRNGMTEDQLKERLTSMGKSMEELRSDISKDLAYQYLFEKKLGDAVNVSDADVKKYYDDNGDKYTVQEQVRASHILVKVDPNASEEDKAAAKKKAQELLAKVKAGGDFAEIAKESSDCPSKAKGGDLGFFERGRMVKPFADAAFAMKVGDISDIVETQFGYHIIKVTDRKPAGKKSFDEVKDSIRMQLENKQRSEATRKYVDGLKAKANIKYTDGFAPEADKPVAPAK